MKTDELDSICIAKVTLDNFKKLANCEKDEIYWTLKQLVNMRRTIIKNRRAYLTKLHEQLLYS